MINAIMKASENHLKIIDKGKGKVNDSFEDSLGQAIYNEVCRRKK